jgi:Cu+-exporting ATPase
MAMHSLSREHSAETGRFVPLAGGLLAMAILLAIYLGVLSALSGWEFTRSQLAAFWPYVVALEAGFGIQVALYLHLRRLSRTHHRAGGAVAASGSSSAAAMLACCTHYLANVAPLIGGVGVITLLTQYQIELFWLGLAINAGGVFYVARQCVRAQAHHAEALR